jgi:uncharacterized protein (DUF1697 family)
MRIALLRGINVGGKNIIKMADLRECFEAQGLEDVTTYIQSGNVVFGSKAKLAALEKKLEVALSKAFDYDATLVVLPRRKLAAVIDDAPRGFGEQPKKHRYDVAFLKRPLTARSAIEKVALKPGVDTAHAGSGVLYFSRLASKASQSRLSRLASLAIYKNMTLRNWNTTTKLLELMGD